MKKIIRVVVGDQSTDTDLAYEIASLWCEYEGIPIGAHDLALFTTASEEDYNQLQANKVYTAESVLAHQLDKLEMILQADEYEKAEQSKRNSPDFLQSFFDSTCYTNGVYDIHKGVFTHPELVVWVNELVQQRNDRIELLCKS